MRAPWCNYLELLTPASVLCLVWARWWAPRPLDVRSSGGRDNATRPRAHSVGGRPPRPASSPINTLYVMKLVAVGVVAVRTLSLESASVVPVR